MITSPAATPAIFSISSAPLANASFGDAARLVVSPIIGEPLHPRELRPLILKAFSPLPPQEDLGPIGQLHIAQISDLAAKNFAFQALVGYHAMASNWALRAGSPEITCQYCAALKEHSISATQESCDNIGQIAQNAALMRSPAASKTV